MSRSRWAEVAKALVPIIASGAMALIESNEEKAESCPPRRSRQGGKKNNNRSTRRASRGPNRKR